LSKQSITKINVHRQKEEGWPESGLASFAEQMYVQWNNIFLSYYGKMRNEQTLFSLHCDTLRKEKGKNILFSISAIFVAANITF
jgi:hypothetical protein